MKGKGKYIIIIILLVIVFLSLCHIIRTNTNKITSSEDKYLSFDHSLLFLKQINKHNNIEDIKNNIKSSDLNSKYGDKYDYCYSELIKNEYSFAIDSKCDNESYENVKTNIKIIPNYNSYINKILSTPYGYLGIFSDSGIISFDNDFNILKVNHLNENISNTNIIDLSDGYLFIDSKLLSYYDEYLNKKWSKDISNYFKYLYDREEYIYYANNKNEVYKINKDTSDIEFVYEFKDQSINLNNIEYNNGIIYNFINNRFLKKYNLNNKELLSIDMSYYYHPLESNINPIIKSSNNLTLFYNNGVVYVFDNNGKLINTIEEFSLNNDEYYVNSLSISDNYFDILFTNNNSRNYLRRYNNQGNIILNQLIDEDVINNKINNYDLDSNYIEKYSVIMDGKLIKILLNEEDNYELLVVLDYTNSENKNYYGDINLDNKVNKSDLKYLYKYLNNNKDLTLIQKSNSDLNLDGIIDNDDYKILNHYIKGDIDIIPCNNNTITFMYADLNNDNIVDNTDLSLINYYINKSIVFDDEVLKKADLNLDKKIDINDKNILSKYLNNIIKTLPYTKDITYGNSKTDKSIDNYDILHIMNYLENKTELSLEEFINADVNLDNVVNIEDKEIIFKYLNGEYDSLPYIESNIKYGDINLDNKVNKEDLVVLKDIVYNHKDISNNIKKSSDLNLDGLVDTKDINILNYYLNSIIDLIPLEKEMIYGDIYIDGKIDNKDLIYLDSYLNKETKLTTNQIINADLNLDLKVDILDRNILSKYLNSIIDSLPYDKIVLYSDINLDNKIDNKDIISYDNYINGKTVLTNDQIMCSDLNFDNVVNNEDKNILIQYLNGNLKSIIYTNKIVYGDVNSDGLIDEKDITNLKSYIQNSKKISFLSTDVNLDSIIDYNDVNIISKYINNYIGSLPYTKLIKYGDVNLDNKIDIKDYNYLNKYLDNLIGLSKESLINSDINLDGIINREDSALLFKYINGIINTLPYNEIIHYGDFNLDNIINNTDEVMFRNYLNNKLTFTNEQLISSDIDLNGKVDNIDKYLFDNYLNHIVNELPYKNTLIFGDINLDSKVDNKDVVKLSNYINNVEDLSNYQLINSDLNIDGKIDNIDKDILFKFITGSINKLPYVSK